MIFKFELSLILIVSLCSNVVLASFNYEVLVIEKVCNHRILTEIENHYTSIELTCNWTKFIDFNLNKRIVIDEENFIFYNIKFNPSKNPIDSKYRILKNNLFQNLKVKSLILSGIGLESIESNAFDNSSFFYATHLDLSLNKIAKIPAKMFENLPSLEHLNLSNNHMSFADNNFVKCKRLRNLDLSSNHIQYITSNQFNGLSSIELIDLSNNNIDKIEACTFTNIKIRSIAKLYNPPLINLYKNPIECECDVFYVNRVLKFRLNLTCTSPIYYRNRDFSDLNGEDPSYKCKYDQIEKMCDLNSMSLREIILVTVCSFLIVLILICVCCFCSKNVKKADRIRILRNELNVRSKPKETKKYYQIINQDSNENDQKKLMLNQA